MLVPESRFRGVEWPKLLPDAILRFCPPGKPILGLVIFLLFGIFSRITVFAKTQLLIDVLTKPHNQNEAKNRAIISDFYQKGCLLL